jgi:hypothetical protein
MPPDNTYSQFVQQVKQQILESRYQAATLVNRELLLLYYNICKMLHQKIKQAKWGDKTLQNISADLQKELPGLKGFSFRNLKNMRKFFEAYASLPIGQTLSAQLQQGKKGQTASALKHDLTIQNLFFSLSFSHHLLIISLKSLGITYIDHKNRCVFNGSDLGKEYSANGLQQRCVVQAENRLAQRQHLLQRNQPVEVNINSSPKIQQNAAKPFEVRQFRKKKVFRQKL